MNELLQKAALLGDTWVIGLLLMASILSVAVMVERWRAFRVNRVDFSEFVAKLKNYLEARDIAGALAYCQLSPAMEIQVTAAGLAEFARGAHSVAEAMKSALLIARARFEKNLVILATLGNNAPFIGLLGTVLGVIKAFHDLGAQGSSGVSAVMAGISTALIATAFGILLAIPAVVANNYFQTRLKQATQNAQSLIHLLQVYLQAHPQGDCANPVDQNRGVAA